MSWTFFVIKTRCVVCARRIESISGNLLSNMSATIDLLGLLQRDSTRRSGFQMPIKVAVYIRATAWHVVTKMNSYAKSADTYRCDASRLIVGRVLMLDLPMRKEITISILSNWNVSNWASSVGTISLKTRVKTGIFPTSHSWWRMLSSWTFPNAWMPFPKQCRTNRSTRGSPPFSSYIQRELQVCAGTNG